MFKRSLKVGLIIIFVLVMKNVGTLHAAAMPWIQLLLLDDNNPSPPTVLRVPDDYATIQEAIDFATDGNRVIVEAGTYVENIDFKGKTIRVQAAPGSRPIIDGNNGGSVVTFSSGEGPGSQIEGFSIINGTGTNLPAPFSDSGGGGILCDGSSPTIKNNFIYSCTAGYGAGILSTGESTHISNPEITNNTIYDNNGANGAGIFCNYSSPDIAGNTIRGNTANAGGGIACWHKSSPDILNNRIYNNIAGSNGGGGIRVYNLSAPQIINNTVYGNFTSGSGGALFVKHGTPTVTNSIFWNNEASDTSDEIWVGEDLSTPSVLNIDYSNVQGGQAAVIIMAGSTLNWGLAMINADPLFFDPGNDDFHLRQDPPQPLVDNPCVDKGDPASAWLNGSTRTDDVLDSGILDMGFHYTD